MGATNEWDEKQAAIDALAVQDACNLSGIVRSWCSWLAVMPGGTDERNRHPVSQLFAGKAIELTRMGFADSEGYSQAYQACKLLAEAEETIFMREYYPWGRTPTYRLPDGSLQYHWEGKQLSWEEVRPLILDSWRPLTWDEQRDWRELQAQEEHWRSLAGERG